MLFLPPPACLSALCPPSLATNCQNRPGRQQLKVHNERREEGEEFKNDVRKMNIRRGKRDFKLITESGSGTEVHEASTEESLPPQSLLDAQFPGTEASFSLEIFKKSFIIWRVALNRTLNMTATIPILQEHSYGDQRQFN